MDNDSGSDFVNFKKRRVNSSFWGKLKSLFEGKRKIVTIGVIVVLLLLGWCFLAPKGGLVQSMISNVATPEKKPRYLNILLLGNAGGAHAGSELTDSIIVVSVDREQNKAVLISIPRDLWIDGVKEKVNALYEIGQDKGEGLAYAKEQIGQIVGLPIDYGVRVDFNGFYKAIDLVGGVDVEVPASFDDYNYPIEGKETDLCGNNEQEMDLDEAAAGALKLSVGKHKLIVTPSGKVASDSGDFACRFEHISFDKGTEHMNGAIALKFVRSRQGTNGEGSDFARSRRQQLVLEAFRKKVLSLETLANPVKVFSLIDTLGKSVETDLPRTSFGEYYSLVKSLGTTENIVLGRLPNGESLFINPPVDKYGSWVLIPANNDYTQVQALVKTAIESTSAAFLEPSPRAAVVK